MRRREKERKRKRCKDYILNIEYNETIHEGPIYIGIQ
jgi:hypothetical protein